MSAVTVSVGTDWTLILDLTNKWIQSVSISRESPQTLYVRYTAPAGSPADADDEWIVTKGALGIETRRIATGGKIWAKLADDTGDVEVNYD